MILQLLARALIVAGGLDFVLDGMMRPAGIRGALPLLRRGGRMVGLGEPASRRELARIPGWRCAPK